MNGPFGSDLLTSELTNSGVPVIYIRDISSGRYERTSSVFITPTKAAELTFCNAKPGDVLVAKVGDPPGIAAIYPAGDAEGIVTQDVIRIRPNTELVSVFYLQAFLNSRLAHQEMAKIMVEGTRLRFSLGQFKEISVPVPPLPLQQKFAALVHRVEHLRAVHKEALWQAEPPLRLASPSHIQWLTASLISLLRDPRTTWRSFNLTVERAMSCRLKRSSLLSLPKHPLTALEAANAFDAGGVGLRG